MLALDEGTKAYVAGIIDSAALIKTRTVGDQQYAHVEVSSTNKQMLEFLAGLTDVKVTQTRRPLNLTQGGTGSRYDKPGEDWSNSHRWQLTGARATVFLANIKPYLVFKTAEAAKMVALGKAANFKPATLNKMKVLGWDIPSIDRGWTEPINQPELPKLPEQRKPGKKPDKKEK